jgi:hypothetical protein
MSATVGTHNRQYRLLQHRATPDACSLLHSALDLLLQPLLLLLQLLVLCSLNPRLLCEADPTVQVDKYHCRCRFSSSSSSLTSGAWLWGTDTPWMCCFTKEAAALRRRLTSAAGSSLYGFCRYFVLTRRPSIASRSCLSMLLGAVSVVLGEGSIVLSLPMPSKLSETFISSAWSTSGLITTLTSECNRVAGHVVFSMPSRLYGAACGHLYAMHTMHSAHGQTDGTALQTASVYSSRRDSVRDSTCVLLTASGYHPLPATHHSLLSHHTPAHNREPASALT